MPLRVCSPVFGISPESNQGGEVYERETLRALGATGADVNVILRQGQPHPVGPGLRYTELPATAGPLGSAQTAWRMARAIGREHRMPGFDILRVHSLPYLAPIGLLARTLAGAHAPIAAQHHHLDPNPQQNRLIRLFAPRMDVITTDSQFSKRQLGEMLHIDTGNVRIVYSGIEERYKIEPRDADLASRLGIVPGEIVCLCLSALTVRKNQQHILAAFAALSVQERAGMRLVLAGDGPLRSDLEHQAAALGIADCVTFAGYVPEEEKVRYYNLADIFLFSSRMEGFGLVVAEAMACGKPVLTTDSGSLPEVVEDGVTGLVSPLADPAAMSAQIRQLAASPELRTRMGEAGAERVQKLFRWDAVARHVADIYQEVAQSWAAAV